MSAKDRARIENKMPSSSALTQEYEEIFSEVSR